MTHSLEGPVPPHQRESKLMTAVAILLVPINGTLTLRYPCRHVFMPALPFSWASSPCILASLRRLIFKSTPIKKPFPFLQLTVTETTGTYWEAPNGLQPVTFWHLPTEWWSSPSFFPHTPSTIGISVQSLALHLWNLFCGLFGIETSSSWGTQLLMVLHMHRSSC